MSVVETFKMSLYACGCGYKTTHNGNANKHKKVICGHEMKFEMTEFVTKRDYDGKTNTTSGNVASESVVYNTEKIVNNTAETINNSTHNDNSTTTNDDSVNITTNINFVLPSGTTKEDFMELVTATHNIGFRPPERVVKMPGVVLTLTRGANKLPGALVERGNRIFEKLPDGSERVMAKKKAVQTYTQEAIEAMCSRPPDPSISVFLDTDRGFKRTKMSIRDAAQLRVTNPPGYHRGVPDLVKRNHQKIESYTGECLDAITAENKAKGFV